MKPIRNFLLTASLALPSAYGATFVYNNTTSGTTQWSAGTNWDATPLSAPSTTLTIGNAAALAASDAIVSNNDIAGDFRLNILNMTYAGPAVGPAPTVTLSGNRLEFVSDAANPTMVFNTTGTVKPVVAINNEILLTNDLGITATTSATLGGLISGTGKLTKSGTGILTLTAPSNSYTGNTTISAGVLDVGDMANDSLGVGGLLFTGGVLQGHGIFTRNFNTSGLVSAADGEIAGPTGGFSAKDGPLEVNFGGESAQVTLSGPSNRLGNGFILNSSTANNKVTVVNPIALNGSARTFTVNSGTGGDSAELSGVLSGAAPSGLTKQGAGSLTLSNANTYAGVTTVSAGSLVISNGDALGTPASAVVTATSVADGARLQLTEGITTNVNESITIAGTGGAINAGALHAGNGGGTWAGPIALNPAARIGATPGNTLIITGTIANGTGTGISISGQSGTGTVVLNPAASNTYTGQTNLVRGILRLGKTDALPVTTVIDAKDGANSVDATVLDLASFSQTIAGLFDTGANANNVITNSVADTTSTLTINNTANRIYDGIIEDGAGTVELVKGGTSMQTLTGANTYSGNTTINVGALVVANDTGLGNTTGITTVNSTGTTATGGRLVVSNDITCAENIILAGESEVAGGYNASLESSSGTHVLDGNITLLGNGGQRINSTGTGGSLALNGAIARSGTDAGILVLRTGDPTATMTLNNTIDLNGKGINVQGTGTVILNAQSTDLTSASVAFGGPQLTLKLGITNALPDTVDLSIGTTNTTTGNDQGNVDLAGFNQTVRALSAIRGTGGTPSDATFRKITNSSQNPSLLTAGNTTVALDVSTFDGVIEDGAGGIALTKTGAGTLTLSGANTYTGATTVSEGTLALVGGSQTSPITVANGAFLGFTLDSPTTSTASVDLSLGAVKISGSPTAPSYTLLTTTSTIIGTPVLDAPITGYSLVVEGGKVLKLNATGGGNTFADWLAIHSPATGFATDSDHDGVSNGVENVLGTNPNTPSAGLTQVSASGSSVTFNHTLNPTIASDVSYSYQWSTDLLEWKASAETNSGLTTATITPSAPVGGVVTVTTTINSGPTGKLFLRLKANQP